jgi:hypothetical protein
MRGSKDLKIDWMYRLKKKKFFSILDVLTVGFMVTMAFLLLIFLRILFMKVSSKPNSWLYLLINISTI